ncbi:hypothetical protein [Bacillus phage YungSlug]|nr:hypothetical protein [Bacillus phage YungSlug]
MLYKKINKTDICKTCGEPSCEFYSIDKNRSICAECKSKIDLIVESIGKRIIKETKEDERKRKTKE